MPITLGSLRQFCAEIASPDSAGATADREFMEWINQALSRLYKEIDTDLTRREVKIAVPPQEEGDDLQVTQGSASIVRATNPFLQKWLDERWSLHIEADPDTEFALSAIDEIDPLQATLRDGDDWILDTDTDLTFFAVKNKFYFPQASEIYRVQLVRDSSVVAVLAPDLFDHQKDWSPTMKGSFPTICTFRNGYIEVWPSPGEEYYRLAVTYRLAFSQIDTDADDDTEVEWADYHLDVLKKAIVLEAAVTQGKEAPIPFPVAEREFVRAVEQLRQLATKDVQPGPMSLQPPLIWKVRDRIPTDHWQGTLEDI